MREAHSPVGPHTPDPKLEGYTIRDKRHGLPEESGSDATQATPAEQLAKLQEEVTQTKDHYLRALAEVENIKKRLQREKDEHVKFAAESLVRDLLPILDSFDQAVMAADKSSEVEAVRTGIHLIQRQLMGLLEKEGVKRMATVGHPFDPHLHEAVAQISPQKGQADGLIVEEVHAGYTMHGKVVRSAMVKVAKKTADSV